MTPAEKRRAWAYALISRCQTPPPRYGSPEWLALPDGPEKVAAVIIAAEAWALDGDHLLDNLTTELEASWRAHKAAEDREFVARREGHQRAWTGHGFRPDPAIEDDIDREWREWVSGDAA